MNRVELVVVKFLYGAIMFIEGLNDLGLRPCWVELYIQNTCILYNLRETVRVIYYNFVNETYGILNPALVHWGLIAHMLSKMPFQWQ